MPSRWYIFGIESRHAPRAYGHEQRQPGKLCDSTISMACSWSERRGALRSDVVEASPRWSNPFDSHRLTSIQRTTRTPVEKQ